MGQPAGAVTLIFVLDLESDGRKILKYDIRCFFEMMAGDHDDIPNLE